MVARHLVDDELLFGVVSPRSLGSGGCWENDCLVWKRGGEEDAGLSREREEGEKVKGKRVNLAEKTRRRELVRLVAADSMPCIKILAGEILTKVRRFAVAMVRRSGAREVGRNRPRSRGKGGGGWWLWEKVVMMAAGEEGRE